MTYAVAKPPWQFWLAAGLCGAVVLAGGGLILNLATVTNDAVPVVVGMFLLWVGIFARWPAYAVVFYGGLAAGAAAALLLVMAFITRPQAAYAFVLTPVAFLYVGAAVVVIGLPFVAMVRLFYRVSFDPPDSRLCARCGYELAGLPEVAPCPECGVPRAATK